MLLDLEVMIGLPFNSYRSLRPSPLSGTEYSGDIKKDLKKRNKLFAEKRDLVQEYAAEAAASNPFERIWKTKSAGLIKMAIGGCWAHQDGHRWDNFLNFYERWVQHSLA